MWLGKGVTRKTWKKRWFILQGEYLYYFNDDGAKKPKGVIRLAQYVSTKITEKSSYNRPYTFKLVVNANVSPETKVEAKNILLSAVSSQERDDWRAILDSSLEVKRKYGFGELRGENSCYCKIFDAKLDIKEHHFDSYCTIFSDNIQKGRTPTVFSSSSPVFDQEYDFEIEPTCRFIIVQLKDHKKKDAVMGQVIVPINDLEDQKMHDLWHKLYPTNSSSDSHSVGLPVGEIRIGIQLRRDTILPDKHYDPLFALLIGNSMSLVKQLIAVSNKKEKLIAECLVRAFEMRRSAVSLLKVITAAEIENTQEPSVLFRENSVAAKAVETYMRIVGLPYLHSILKPIVTQILQSQKSCELDEFRIDEKQQDKKLKLISRNQKTLIHYVNLIFQEIEKKVDVFPSNLRNIFEHVWNTTAKKWPDHPTAKYTAISGFIFLRFFCPSLFSPKLYDLTSSQPPPNKARDLTLIAKTLQTTANLVVFGKKEVFMHRMNSFVEDKREAMKKYLELLKKIPDIAIDEIPTKRDNINWGMEMSRVQFHFEDNMEAMEGLFGKGDEDLVKLKATLSELKTIVGTDESKPITLNTTNFEPPLILEEELGSSLEGNDKGTYSSLSSSTNTPSIQIPSSYSPSLQSPTEESFPDRISIPSTNSLSQSVPFLPPLPTRPSTCQACSLPITDTTSKQLLDLKWHEACLRCSVCNKVLSGPAALSKNNVLFCTSCLNLPQNCSVCEKPLSISSNIVQIYTKWNFHKECFLCSNCSSTLSADNCYHDTNPGKENEFLCDDCRRNSTKT
uniref:Ras GTPase-activating protein n=1 Tax=Arcella intermedia TaxID=1963864 RepID=A0A6B2KXZ5_9EUKA